jgi:hypothetical protein
MAKTTNDSVMDAALDVLATATKLVACSAQPTTYTEANATYFLAGVVIDGTDFTKANGDVSGRKTTLQQQASVSITNTGTATHVATIITGSSTLLDVTTCTSQALTSGGTVTFPAFDHEITDPA